ncbi:MAG TPA: response regulator transcription factor [Chitinophagaceae bacterium]|nr:response regulator transcription factor [Chitinophagaceae bacterium]
MSKITILLVDDHKLIRESWSFILNSDPRFEVIGETSSGEEAVMLVKKLKPNIVLMDVNMAPMNGFDATEKIVKHSSSTKVICVSMHAMPAYARRMLQVGAMGYVTKNSSRQEMVSAIVEVYNGNQYICEEVRNILAQQDAKEEGDLPDLNVLSDRELGVAQLIRKGLSSKEIGIQLDISIKTVEVHRYNILRKLNQKNTVALVNYLNSQGL